MKWWERCLVHDWKALDVVATRVIRTPIGDSQFVRVNKWRTVRDVCGCCGKTRKREQWVSGVEVIEPL